ncbi:hypothetical protein OOU_Y34scaffold00560g2 [Pyricularia oryzae Y34]|uniref:Nudix hydrolase domain-containing protein n=2 Tax=Pyricularia oryzae TaxID=318829 RepID=A0AA97PKI5_PYRO3|nr:hypothetical protein OOU_Y34scaffold00560g2 [Pyricularia oryzae Y34]
MHPILLFLVLGFTLTIGASPTKQLETVKSGSVHGADSSRIRCGVVAFNPDGSVWMVAAKTQGWILPKGGYDQDQDHNMIECVQREAMEEAGLTLSSIYPLDLDEGTLHWYTAKVTADGPRTDKNLDEEKRPLPRPVKSPERGAFVLEIGFDRGMLTGYKRNGRTLDAVSGKNDCLQEVFLPQHRLIQGNQQLSEKRSIINTSVCSDPIRGVPELGLHPLPPMCGSCSRRRAICVPDVFKVSRRQAITRSRMQDHDSPPSGTVSPSSRMSLAKFDVGSQRCIVRSFSPPSCSPQRYHTLLLTDWTFKPR